MSDLTPGQLADKFELERRYGSPRGQAMGTFLTSDKMARDIIAALRIAESHRKVVEAAKRCKVKRNGWDGSMEGPPEEIDVLNLEEAVNDAARVEAEQNTNAAKPQKDPSC